MTLAPNPAAPTPPGFVAESADGAFLAWDTAPARIAMLDVIRGVAVLGILLMNVVSFAMPEAAYMNPRAYGSHGLLDYSVWAVEYVLIDGKMRGLFSLLFGASMLLVVERAEARGENPARVHFCRMAWLLAFGMAHLLLVWSGDILQHYALVGMVAYAFRRKDPSQLVAGALVLLILQAGLMLGWQDGLDQLIAAAKGAHPPTDILTQLGDYTRSFGLPDRAYLAHDVTSYRGSYATVLRYHFDEAIATPVQTLAAVGLETLAYMLLGMAALRSGLLSGGWERQRYWRWVAVGFGIGIPGYAAMAGYAWWRGFDLASVGLTAITLSTPIRPSMILGWASLIILLARPGGALTERLAAAGRMAFTNYLVSSLICTGLFYGYGFGLYGRLGRADLLLVVAAVWALILSWSRPWLRRFRFGPFEWLWRSLSRGRLQPMRGGAL